MAGLLKYFRRQSKQNLSVLPDPKGSLSEKVPSSSIELTNDIVHDIIDEKTTSRGKRGEYLSLTPAQKFSIGKRAAENGVTATIRYYAKAFPDLPLSKLKETTVRRLKDNYQSSLKTDQGSSKELPGKKRGRPLMIGVDLDQQVRDYISYLRTEGAVINTHVVIGIGKGIVMGKDSNLLACNGGGIVLTKDWARNVLRRMGMVKRRANTKTKVTVEEFDETKKLFLLDIKNTTHMDEIPPQLIINWDHTGINYVPVSSWTMEAPGTKRVEIIGKDDKRQLTAVLGCSMSGDFLPPQLIYQGKTKKCLPHFKFSDNWDVTYSENHWANEDTTRQYIMNILLPYLQDKRKELKLLPTHRALVLFDNFKGQSTEEILKLLDSNDINVVMIPANCTDRLQPLDVSVNKSVKEFLRQKFHSWYAESVSTQLNGTKAKEPVDLRLSVVKPLGAKWLVDMYDYMKTKPEIIRNGFKEIGILESATLELAP